MNANLKQQIIDLLSKSDSEIDYRYHLDNEDFEDFDDIRNILEEAGAFNVDIIYYSRAIEYLSNNDASLNRSLALAEDMGYTPGNLNSELLASLLASEIERENFEEMESEVTDLIDGYEEDEDEEEDEEETTEE